MNLFNQPPCPHYKLHIFYLLSHLHLSTPSGISFRIFTFKHCKYSFIHSLVLSLRGRAGRNQSPVMSPVWIWHNASWEILGGSLPLPSPVFRRSHLSPPGACTSATTREILGAKGGTTWARNMADNFA